MTIQLSEGRDILYVNHQFAKAYGFAIEKCDIVVVEDNVKMDILNVYGVSQGKTIAISDIDEKLFNKSPKDRLKLIPMFEVSDKVRKSETDYKKIIDSTYQYYNSMKDSLLQLGTKRGELLSKYVITKQYQELSNLSESTQNKDLLNLLKSSNYVNDSVLNDKILGKIISTYIDRNIINNSTGESLEVKFKDSYNNYSKNFQRRVKLNIISEMIFRKYDRKNIISFMDKFVHEFGMNKEIQKLMAGIEYGVSNSDDLSLKSYTNQSENWNTLLKKHKGKAIYVDFWASWCAPCIGELPHSVKLKKELGNDVVFVYLAYSDTEEKWKPAAQKYNVVENSYFITNSKSSNFITGNKITTIPRYMIIDKNGKIVNPDAPRPSSTEIRTMLKKYQ